MKLFKQVILTGVLGIGFCVSVFAGGKVSIHKSGANEGMVPVLLKCEENLSCFSLTLSHNNFAIDPKDIRINEERFPWKKRAVTISADQDKGELIFTVADLIGQNSMVSRGEGILFSVPVEELGESIKILDAQAFNQQGEVVQLIVQNK